MRRIASVAMIVMSLLAASCGTADTRDPNRPRSTGPITTTSPPPFDETELEFAQQFWHSGFRVELTRAEVWTSKTLLTNRISYWLTLWGDFENQGDDVASFDPEMAIVASGTSYGKRSADPPPRLLPSSPALGKLTFLIPENLDLKSAELVVGAADESQARIPLGPLGDAVRLEPADVALSGQLTTESIDFDFTGGTLRYDLPDLHRQVESGKRALTLHFDVTSRSPGDGHVTVEDLALILPDGSAIEPTVAQLDALPGDEDGVTTSDLFASFVVDEMVRGDFTLRYTLDDSLVPEDGIVEAEFDFAL